jgi:hypothetical protein
MKGPLQTSGPHSVTLDSFVDMTRVIIRSLA